MSFSCRQNNWHSLEQNSSLMWQIKSGFCKIACFLCFHLSSVCFLLMFCFIMLDYFKCQIAKSWIKVPLDSGLTNGEYIAHIIFLLIGLLTFVKAVGLLSIFSGSRNWNQNFWLSAKNNMTTCIFCKIAIKYVSPLLYKFGVFIHHAFMFSP